jgi:DNA adenine methylase
LRYHGGKWLLAPWIISHFPPHRIYVEPYGGAASVLLRKRPSYAEVYNDLDSEIVNVFRVLRDPASGARLAELLHLTPFARDEFEVSYLEDADPVEQARRTIMRSFMGFGSAAASRVVTGFRANSNRSGTTPARDWANFPTVVPAFVERLREVVIENREALEVMSQHDGPQTLHYVDPPYHHDTRNFHRGQTGQYRHEMTDGQHATLLGALQGLAGMVVLSGYDCPLYRDQLAGWTRIERKALADGARERTEVLWLNHAATATAKGMF